MLENTTLFCLPYPTDIRKSSISITTKGKEVEFGFTYNSGSNEEWESVESIRKSIRLHVDPDFDV